MRVLQVSILSLALLSPIVQAQNAERRGIGLVPNQTVRALGAVPAGAAPATIEPRRSLFVTDQEILAKFTFAEVMDAIARGAPGGGITWKPSLGFVHTSESKEPEDMKVCPGDLATVKNCFGISPALKEVFLPNRQRNLEAFVGISP